MLIPVRCMTCGKMVADKVAYWERRLRELKPGDPHPEQHPVFDGKTLPVTAESRVFTELGLTRYCCRRTLLTAANLMDRI